jgi:hypothetical protein
MNAIVAVEAAWAKKGGKPADAGNLYLEALVWSMSPGNLDHATMVEMLTNYMVFNWLGILGTMLVES